MNANDNILLAKIGAAAGRGTFKELFDDLEKLGRIDAILIKRVQGGEITDEQAKQIAQDITEMR